MMRVGRNYQRREVRDYDLSFRTFSTAPEKISSAILPVEFALAMRNCGVIFDYAHIIALQELVCGNITLFQLDVLPHRAEARRMLNPSLSG
jgi:hypothetical protein